MASVASVRGIRHIDDLAIGEPICRAQPLTVTAHLFAGDLVGLYFSAFLMMISLSPAALVLTMVTSVSGSIRSPMR